MAALEAHPLVVDVQRAALLALLNACCFGLEGTPGVPTLLEAIPLVLAALRAFPTDLDVQEYGSKSLTKMCKMDASVAEAVAAAGALGLFIKALNLDITDDDTCIAAVVAIAAIALAPAALPQPSTGIDAVVRALRRHEMMELFAMAACKTLGAYLQCAVTRERGRRLSADYVVKAIAQIHNDDKDVQAAAEDALKDPQA